MLIILLNVINIVIIFCIPHVVINKNIDFYFYFYFIYGIKFIIYNSDKNLLYKSKIEDYKNILQNLFIAYNTLTNKYQATKFQNLMDSLSKFEGSSSINKYVSRIHSSKDSMISDYEITNIKNFLDLFTSAYNSYKDVNYINAISHVHKDPLYKAGYRIYLTHQHMENKNIICEFCLTT